jgi:LmbE family N-acetylglucosaminyl deacetylase
MENNHTIKPEPALELPFRILVIAAHHDDIEFGVAGSAAHWIDQGAEVIYCIVTDGGAGSNDPDTNIDELIENRQHEQVCAASVVGVKDVRFLGYRDGALQPTMDLRRDLTRIIRELKPDRVVCQDPTNIFVRDYYVNHPDHRAAGEAAIYAVFPSSESRPIFPELLEEGFEPHKVRQLYLNHTPNPDTYVDISDTMERKLRSLRCHVTQLGEGEDFDNGAGKWIRESNQKSGEEFGVGAVEQYRVMHLDWRDRQREEQAAEQENAESETETVTA